MVSVSDLPKGSNVALIDADSIVYVIAGFYEQHGFTRMKKELDLRIIEILELNKATHYLGVVGSSAPTFRHTLAITKPYKGQRPSDNQVMQVWKEPLKHHLIDNWQFVRAYEIEGDDVVAIAVAELRRHNDYTRDVIADTPHNIPGRVDIKSTQRYHIDYTVCHIDHDLNQLPGRHYDFNRKNHTNISEQEALKNLIYQLIVGCTGDNVPGLPRKGKAYAEQFFNNCPPHKWMEGIEWAYKAYVQPNGEEMFKEQQQLLTLLSSHPSFIPSFIPVDSNKLQELKVKEYSDVTNGGIPDELATLFGD